MFRANLQQAKQTMGKGLPDQKTTVHQRPQASAAGGGGDRYSLVTRSPAAAPHGPLCSVSFPYVAARCSRAIRGTPRPRSQQAGYIRCPAQAIFATLVTQPEV